MPKPLKKEKIVEAHFTWLLSTRNDVYYADGRSNDFDLGRHSLGTADREQALRNLKVLDLKQAVKFGRAPREALAAAPKADTVTLDEGWRLYVERLQAPRNMGGVAARTAKRYQAVLDKFIPFAKGRGVTHWAAVTEDVALAYGSHLDHAGYAPANVYLECTLIKQIVKWLIRKKKLLPESCLLNLRMTRSDDTTTYCYKPDEVDAMVALCRADPDLNWMADVIVGLSTTGLRSGELAMLTWSNIDLPNNCITLVDESLQVAKGRRAAAATIKARRTRIFPIHEDLRAVLERLPRAADGRVFRAKLGGRLDPDKVYKALTEKVIPPLAGKFPPGGGEQKGFADGYVHSFRHYFVSSCARQGLPEQMVADWVGHADSRMVRRYYHQFDPDAQRYMKSVKFLNDPGPTPQAAPAEDQQSVTVRAAEGIPRRPRK